ncbi:unnamed protein product [Discula destructiva]
MSNRSLSPAGLAIRTRSRSRSHTRSTSQTTKDPSNNNNDNNNNNNNNNNLLPPPKLTPAIDEIVFPRVYEEVWGAADLARSEPERARTSS